MSFRARYDKLEIGLLLLLLCTSWDTRAKEFRQKQKNDWRKNMGRNLFYKVAKRDTPLFVVYNVYNV
jgi:hypothetical protein